MNLNPMNLLQLKNSWDRFKENHPKFPLFLKAAAKQAVMESSIIEIRITTPDGKAMETNLKLNASDVEMYRQMLELFGD